MSIQEFLRLECFFIFFLFFICEEMKIQRGIFDNYLKLKRRKSRKTAVYESRQRAKERTIERVQMMQRLLVGLLSSFCLTRIKPRKIANNLMPNSYSRRVVASWHFTCQSIFTSYLSSPFLPALTASFEIPSLQINLLLKFKSKISQRATHRENCSLFLFTSLYSLNAFLHYSISKLK